MYLYNGTLGLSSQKAVNIICPDDLMQAKKDIGSEYYDGMTYKTSIKVKARSAYKLEMWIAPFVL